MSARCALALLWHWSTAGPLPGETSRQYNANYELVATIDERDLTRNRYFANDASGNAITTIKGKFDGQGTLTAPQVFAFALSNSGGFNFAKAQHFFYASGQAVGSFGQLAENGQFKANFDVNYTPVSASYPSITPAEVVVQFKDTLRILAQRVWGDGNLIVLVVVIVVSASSAPRAAAEPTPDPTSAPAARRVPR